MITERYWRTAAGLSGFLAVAVGAVASHAIADPHLAALAEKASIYGLIHSFLLLWLAEKPGWGFAFARGQVLAGLVLFCGGLYLKALTGWESATYFAPAGGLSFMAAWVTIALAKRPAT